MPSIALAPSASKSQYLMMGRDKSLGDLTDDQYFAFNNVQNRRPTEGDAVGQYRQDVGRLPNIGPNGEVGARFKWSWPSWAQYRQRWLQQNPGASSAQADAAASDYYDQEVKGYPSIAAGRFPGHYSPTAKGAGTYDVIKRDGTVSTTAPWNGIPGTFLPLPVTQLSDVKSQFRYAYQNGEKPTGKGWLTYDIWLQDSPAQQNGFMNAAITHEIMIGIDNWGGYSQHAPAGGFKNFRWWDHEWTDTETGVTWQVYVFKNQTRAETPAQQASGDWSTLRPGLRYNFSALNHVWPNPQTGQKRVGWKFIQFVPTTNPIVAPGVLQTINIGKMLDHLRTRKDENGDPWLTGKEYMTAAEIGVEQQEGAGDLTLWDYRFWRAGASAPAVTAAPAPAPQTAQTTALAPTAVTPTAVTPTAVTPTVVTPTATATPTPTPTPTPTLTPAPQPAPTLVTTSATTTCLAPFWNATTRYMPGDKVRRNGLIYIALPISAKAWNVNSAPEWTATYWSIDKC